MKKFVCIITCAMLAVSAFASSIAAAPGDIKTGTPNVSKAPVQDGKITADEYGGCTPIVFDGSGKNTEGAMTGQGKWTTEKFTVYSAWDSKNLYVGVVIEGDSTNGQGTLPKPGDGDSKNTWQQGDAFQFGFNPGGLVTGGTPAILDVGCNDGKCFVLDNGGRRTKTDKSNHEYSDKINAYCSTYSVDGANYVLEIAFPWNEICFDDNGPAREGKAQHLAASELSKIKEGYVLPWFFMYTNGASPILRTDAADNPWAGSDMTSIGFELLPAPAPTTTPANPVTADSTALLAFAAVASVGIFYSAKRKH